MLVAPVIPGDDGGADEEQRVAVKSMECSACSGASCRGVEKWPEMVRVPVCSCRGWPRRLAAGKILAGGQGGAQGQGELAGPKRGGGDSPWWPE